MGSRVTLPPGLGERLVYSLPVEGENLKTSLKQARTDRVECQKVLERFNLQDCTYRGAGQSCIVLEHPSLEEKVIKVYTWPVSKKIQAHNEAVEELDGRFYRVNLLPVEVHACSPDGIVIITTQAKIQGSPVTENDLPRNHVLKTGTGVYALDNAASNFLKNQSGTYYIDLLETSQTVPFARTHQ